MSNRKTYYRKVKQEGAVTVLVALSLLLLVTTAAFAVSRSSLREIMITGSARTASEVQNLADTGLDWGLIWMDSDNQKQVPASMGAAKNFATAIQLIQRNNSCAGAAGVQALPSDRINEVGFVLPASGETILQDFGSGDGKKKQFDLLFTKMGKVMTYDTTVREYRMMPNVYSVRSTGTVLSSSDGPTFRHVREMFLTTGVN